MAKYVPFKPVAMGARKWPDRTIDKAPAWCSVDLRDGNQALVTPLSIEEKLEYFDLLLSIGFKEIEIGFPSASQIEFDFARRLVDEGRIPDGVAISVLCQARKHLIDRTVESLKGAKDVIFHLYSSTSPSHRKYTYRMDKAETKALAVEGVRMVREAAAALAGSRFRLQFSPECFSSTETDFALEVCEAVMDEWRPTPGNKIIFNLPHTIECCMPNQHADQIEWFIDHLSRRDSAIISLHTHNDRGTGIAASELGLLAGADRVEGTLFGNGERTGNLDIVAMALNMLSQGVDPGLDFSRLPAIAAAYSRLCDLPVHPRHPYAGELVFTAFSGSHQDAIKKAMEARAKAIAERGEANVPWDITYLPIDPKDLGRDYEAIIRINSQSGKGGVAWVLKESYGMDLPRAMHPEVGAYMNKVADQRGAEIKSEEIKALFDREFVSVEEPLRLKEFAETAASGSSSSWKSKVEREGREYVIEGSGKGPIDAFVRSLAQIGVEGLSVTAFHEEALAQGADSSAIAYIEAARKDGKKFWGCGIDANIAQAGIKAVVSAFNRAMR